jgi:hypothetical protein
MRWRVPLTVALIAFVAVSCQDTATEPVEQPVATAPGFNFMNGPESAGAVYRQQILGHISYWVYDAGTQLLGVVSTDPAGLCEEGPGVVPLDLQFAGDWNLNVQSEDWYAWVWDARGQTEMPCVWTPTLDPMAEGMVHFKYEGVGNKEDIKANGQIARTDGMGKTHLNWELSFVYDKKTGEGPLGYRVLKVRLGPDPRY